MMLMIMLMAGVLSLGLGLVRSGGWLLMVILLHGAVVEMKMRAHHFVAMAWVLSQDFSVWVVHDEKGVA